MRIDSKNNGNFAAYLLQQGLAKWPQRIAARCSGQTLSYAELSEKALAMAGYLRLKGLKPGDRALIVLPDSFSFLACFLGSMLAGIIAVPVNDRLRRADYQDCVKECSPYLVIASEGHEAQEAALAENARFLALSDSTLPALLADQAPGKAYPSQITDDCVLYVTSGTTGHPKMVPHTHSDFFAVAEFTGDFFNYRADDVVLSSAKMCHCYGTFASLTLPLTAGATTILDPQKPGTENTLRLLREEKVTLFASVPAFYTLLLLSSEEDLRLENLRLCFSAGETLPAAVYEHWLETTGHQIWQGYGSTEMMTIVTGMRPPDITPGAAGRGLAPYELRILDAGGNQVPEGEPGQLAVRGPTIMRGYYNNTEWSRRVLTPDGWLFTGDMAAFEKGVYTILGRMDDMFKAGGLWVSPTRVENALLMHPAVAQCAVTAGNVGAFSLVRAHVMLKPGFTPSQELSGILRNHALTVLPDFMAPSEVVFNQNLPLTASGKLQRFKLR